MATVRVWYCRGCRMALRCDPARPRACRCQIPVLPAGPTVVQLPEEEGS